MDMGLLERETASHSPVRFGVGDMVDVLLACHLPKRETVMGTGRIHRISQGSSGDTLYWIEGFPMARTSGVLRLVQRDVR
jgi:hypothetical protein